MTKAAFKITDSKFQGKYIAVKQILNDIYIVFLPDEQLEHDLSSVYLIRLDDMFYVRDMTEFVFPKFSSIYIGKIYNDARGDFVVQGNLTLTNPLPGQFQNTDFKVKNSTEYHYRESHKNSVGVVYNLSIKDIVINAISRKKEIVHVIGYRVKTNDEVYLQFNPESDTIVQEVAFYTDLGVTNLKEIYCNENDEVLIVGHIETKKGNLGFFTKLILNTFTPLQDKKG